MKSGEKLSPEVIIKMRAAINDAEGQEILFTGQIPDNGLIESVVIAARGNDTAAPALYPFMLESDVVLHNHPSGLLKPSIADLKIASSLGNQGIGFYIVNNAVTKIYCVSEAVEGHRNKKLDMEDCCSFLLPGGELSRAIEHYETRDHQVQMTEGVVSAFNDNLLNITEAGTGVGKSFAYLVPAIKWCETNNERVVISTATINLQQQLIEKDIPLITGLLGKNGKSNVKSVLVKGRGNYVCLRRLHDVIDDNSLFQEKDSSLQAIFDWSGTTKTGSKSDLSFVPEFSLWSSVCSESDSCMGLRCFYREKCFVLQLKKEAASANILVVNHHLLFSDLAMRMNGAGYDGTAVLPPFLRVVFDEAHTIENSATSFFSQNYNKFILYKHTGRIYSRRKSRNVGLAVTLQSMMANPDDYKEIPVLIADVRVSADNLDTNTAFLMNGEYSLRLTEQTNMELLSPVLDGIRDLHKKMIKLVTYINDGGEYLFSEEEENSDVFEMKVAMQRLKNLAAILNGFLDYSTRDNNIFWVESKRTSKGEIFYSFSNTPLDISEMMQKAVYEPLQTAIFTSATLTVQKKFDFWKGRIGLNNVMDNRVKEFLLSSPFQYRKHVMLGLPTDAPDPGTDDYQAFISAIIVNAIEISEGSALVLFTSYGMLNTTYNDIEPLINRQGITVMKQGSLDRSRLLSKFNTDISSVLFATDSFWEGVDAPGESLKLVIICKLPFRVPTDPIIKARLEAIERNGGNAFMDLSLPEAAMRLKQGFGRLMRRKTDHGVVLILDPRIIRKRYGSILSGSLPETAKSIGSSKTILTDMENFLYNSADLKN
jgi:ATP-dependent DNA helicase DinG